MWPRRPRATESVILGTDPARLRCCAADFACRTRSETGRRGPTLQANARGRQLGQADPNLRGVDVAACEWLVSVFHVLFGCFIKFWIDFYQPLLLFRSDLDHFNSVFALVWCIDRLGTHIFHLNGWIWILNNVNYFVNFLLKQALIKNF